MQHGASWIVDSDPKFLLGARGARPVRLFGIPFAVENEILDIPGVVRAGRALAMPWDAVAPASRILAAHGIAADPPELPAPSGEWLLAQPGLQRFRELLPTARPHQAEGAVFLAFRSAAGLGDEMRLGKSLCSLLATVLVDARRTLCIVDARVVLVWADEWAKWLGVEVLMLAGRGGDEARIFCKLCCGRPSRRPSGRCARCGCAGKQRFRIVRGADRVHAAIEANPAVVVNYELLIGQSATDAAGKTFVVDGLPGQGSVIAKHHFDVAILDEVQKIRGWSTDAKKRGRTIRERTRDLVAPIPRVWALTGTLFAGYVRDAWAPLDIMTNGASTGRGDRLPFSFHVRYCEGGKGEYGWVSTGRSMLADTELPERLAHLWLRRTRRDIGVGLAPKTRQVIMVEADVDPDIVRRALACGTRTTRIDALRRATARAKMPTVAQAIADDVLGGVKTMAFAFNPSTAVELAKAVQSILQKKENGPLARQADAQVWLAADVSIDARHEIAARFREHAGAGAIITTIGAMQVGINCAGASTEHWIDVHHTPAEMQQAEDRPNAVERTHGLVIMYYVIPDSVDDHLIDLVLPKLETLGAVASDATSTEIGQTLRQTPDETMDEVLARLTAGLDLDHFKED